MYIKDLFTKIKYYRTQRRILNGINFKADTWWEDYII